MLISLIVPFFNLEAYVRETLAGLVDARRALGSQASEVEVICVDDGSTDGTGRILDEVSGTAGFRVLHKPNGGEGSARNAGIGAANGGYLMFLDGDDVLLTNALTTAVRLAGEFPQADVIGMRFAAFADGESIPVPVDSEKARSIDATASLPTELVRDLSVFPTLFRRTVVSGLRFSDLSLGADREYVLAVLSRARQVVLSDAVVEGYRVREGSMARARWTVRKIRSLNDHAAHGLASLAASGKRIEPAGVRAVAGHVVSEVPARLARLGSEEGVYELWRHWVTSVADLPVTILPASVRLVRRMILTVGWSRAFSIAVARICRAVNMV